MSGKWRFVNLVPPYNGQNVQLPFLMHGVLRQTTSLNQYILSFSHQRHGFSEIRLFHISAYGFAVRRIIACALIMANSLHVKSEGYE